MWGLVRDLYSSIVLRGGAFYDSTLQIPTNPHLCLTWGRWGLTLTGALCMVKYSEFIEYTNNMNNKLMSKALCIKCDFC